MSNIRINILARELEVKARVIIELLPDLGVTEKKSHSSSIEDEVAGKVRAHFRAAEQAEIDSQRKAEEEKKAAEAEAARKEAEAKAAAEAASRPAPVVPDEVPSPAAAATPPAAAPAQPVTRVLRRTTPVVVSPSDKPSRPPTLPPPRRSDAVRPAAGGPRRSAAVGGRPGAVPGAPPGVPERGKPIYQRKPPPRKRVGQSHSERRSVEGERRFMHPVRTRAKPSRGQDAGGAVKEPVVVHREPINITITEGITVKELAEKLGIRAKELIKELLDRGTLATINQTLESGLATEVAEKFMATVEVVAFEEHEQQLQIEIEEKVQGELEIRAPVVTVMGHVDHGKTSLLDAIRGSDVAAGEAGGITQHIGAYSVTVGDRRVVFVDTPGHAAFTRMRARGAGITDIVVLVVAADDGVMPQTIEAIDHARAAEVAILVAVNKIDKPGAQPDRVKKQLADRGLMPEDWGGDVVMVDVSATEKTNLKQLLEMILLVADMKELKATPSAPGRGIVLEARLDKGRGPVATILVQNGTLRRGDAFIVGPIFGKVRAMLDEHAQPVDEAGPATPVEVLGLTALPEVGDNFQIVTDEVKAKQVANYREQQAREAALASSSRLTLDHLHEQLQTGGVKDLPIVIKGDVLGSVEALAEQLEGLANDSVKINIIRRGAGGINESDVLLASASNAIIVGFNVRADRTAADIAKQDGVDIRLHRVIYEVIDEINLAVAGMLEPTLKETVLGRAEVRDTFRIPKVGMIAGCYITDGKLQRDAKVRVLRDNVVIYDSKVLSLRRFKEDVKEVQSGYECGASVSNFSDVKVGDILEAYVVEEVVEPVASS